MNIHVISTEGVPVEGVKRCIECWCPGDTVNPSGTVVCCKNCTTTAHRDVPKDYHFEYNVTYK